MFFERTLAKTLKNATETFPVVLLTGPRQVGKTTLFEHCATAGRTCLTLDDPQLRGPAKNDPRLFLQAHPWPLLIDEIQYAPELLPYIKIAVDNERMQRLKGRKARQGMFWLTGSQPFRLMRNVSESLAGRIAILEMQGLSQAERFQRPAAPFVPGALTPDARPPLGLAALYELIITGAFPELLATPNMDRKLFYDAYLKTYVERDVRDLTRVGDEHSFVNFLRVAAARTAQLLNYSDMARDVGVSVNTIKSWVSILETSGIIHLLQPWHGNLTQRTVRTPKLYFLDTGLCSYLSGWKTADALSNGVMSGSILETYVVSEILKSHWHCGREARVWFYRDKDLREIDLLVESENGLHPVEIKRSASPNTWDARHFAALSKTKLRVGKGAVICLYDNLIPLNANVDIVPVSYLG